MSKKPTIYLETTILNFFFDFKNQSTEKKIDTVYFWNNNLKNFNPVVSLAVVKELQLTPILQWRKNLLKLI